LFQFVQLLAALFVHLTLHFTLYRIEKQEGDGMAIISPIMSFVVDKEMGFPIPSEREKINKALRRYRSILVHHPHRTDTPEITEIRSLA
jgi:hypothetical protein